MKDDDMPTPLEKLLGSAEPPEMTADAANALLAAVHEKSLGSTQGDLNPSRLSDEGPHSAARQIRGDQMEKTKRNWGAWTLIGITISLALAV